MGDDFAHELVAAEEVEVEGCLEVFEWEVGDWLAGAGAAGVVDEDVYGAEASDDRLMQTRHRVHVRYVGDDALTADSERLDFGDGAVEGGLRATADGDVDAFAGEREGGYLAESSAAAGYEGYFALYSEVHIKSLRVRLRAWGLRGTRLSWG